MSALVQKHKVLIGDVLLIFMTVIWGSTFFMIKAHLPFIDPVGMLFYRFGITALVLAIYLRAKGFRLFQNAQQGLVVGFALWLVYVPQNIGMLYTTATNSGFITALFVAFIPLFSILFFKHRPTHFQIAAALLALTGLWFLTGGISGLNKGDVITFITPVACAFYVLYSDSYLKKGMHPLVLCFQIVLAVAVFSLLWMLAFQRSFAITSHNTYWIMAYLTVCATLMTFVVNMYVQKISSPMKVSIIFSLEPLFAALFAWWFLQETLHGWQWLGGCLIVGALMISEIPTKPKIQKLRKSSSQVNLCPEPTGRGIEEQAA